LSAAHQLGLLSWTRPEPAPRAPEGVKRAAKAGSGVDADILAVAATLIGCETPLPTVHGLVKARGAMCLEDTVRRRLNALERMGLLRLGDGARVGRVLIEWVR
jgi:hypothetical protein